MSGEQLTSTAGMTPAQIAEALREGRLAEYLGEAPKSTPEPQVERLSPEDQELLLRHASPETIRRARAAGALDPEPETETDRVGGKGDQGARTEQPRTTKERLARMTPADVAKELREGKLDGYLRGEDQ